MWYFPISINDLDLIDGMNRWRQAAMYTKDLVVDDHAQCEKIEHVRKIMPNIGVAVFSCALSVKAVRLRDAS